MKTFKLNRLEDESGISGTGVVAEGVEFSNGQCAISWLTKHTSVAIYPSVAEVRAIHGHDGKTEIVFDTITPVDEAYQLLLSVDSFVQNANIDLVEAHQICKKVMTILDRVR